MVQNTLNDCRLKFGDKHDPPMKIDADPIEVEEAHFINPVEIMMVETTEGLDTEVKKVTMLNYTEKMKVISPRADE